MRQNYIILILLMLAGSLLTASSQKFDAGFYNGLNYSDIKSQDLNGKWRSIPGPVIGFRFGYSFNDKIGFQSGIDMLAIYYEHLSYNHYQNPEFLMSSSIAPYYFPISKSDFSFLRFPILLKYSVPGIINLDLKAGIFYSVVQSYSVNLSNYYSPAKPNMNDFGYCFSSGLSYPLGYGFRTSLSFSYVTGTKKIVPEMKYRHGASEIIFGISYGILNKSVKKQVNITDSTTGKLSYTILGGANISGNLSSNNRDKYSYNGGVSAGFTVNYSLSEKTSLRFGALFDSKGYSLSDSSYSFYRYAQIGDRKYYVNTKTDIDYFTLPLLIDQRFGPEDIFLFQAGPWVSCRLNAHSSGEAYYTARSQSDFRIIKTTVSDDIEGRIKKIDYGYQVGAGISIPLKNISAIDFYLSWRSGLTDVIHSSAFYNNYDRKISGTVLKNGTLSFIIGIIIPQNL